MEELLAPLLGSSAPQALRENGATHSAFFLNFT
jgi:hypothetical protein